MKPLVSSNLSFGDQDLSALKYTINLIMVQNNLKGFNTWYVYIF
jgi:hypothetical protein